MSCPCFVEMWDCGNISSDMQAQLNRCWGSSVLKDALLKQEYFRVLVWGAKCYSVVTMGNCYCLTVNELDVSVLL